MYIRIISFISLLRSYIYYCSFLIGAFFLFDIWCCMMNIFYKTSDITILKAKLCLYFLKDILTLFFFKNYLLVCSALHLPTITCSIRPSFILLVHFIRKSYTFNRQIWITKQFFLLTVIKKNLVKLIVKI